MGVCLSTIIVSILATRPKVSSGTFTQEDIEAKRVNLLFFGNFHGVKLEDYERGVYAMIGDLDSSTKGLSRIFPFSEMFMAGSTSISASAITSSCMD